VTFKELKKRVSLKATAQQQLKLFERLHNKPFWIWDIEEHKQEDIKANGDCCFNLLGSSSSCSCNYKEIFLILWYGIQKGSQVSKQYESESNSAQWEITNLSKGTSYYSLSPKKYCFK
jgi:hypothetical protein